jgi:hypothetical protein
VLEARIDQAELVEAVIQQLSGDVDREIGYAGESDDSSPAPARGPDERPPPAPSRSSRATPDPVFQRATPGEDRCCIQVDRTRGLRPL